MVITRGMRRTAVFPRPASGNPASPTSLPLGTDHRRGEILTVEVERGGSHDFIGFRNIYLRALLGAGFAAMLLFVLHLLGDLLEIGSRTCYFAASLFYNRISRVPKGFASLAPLQPLKCCV